MSLLRFLWIAFCLWWAFVSYGDTALEIGLAGHLGITLIGRFLHACISKLLAFVFTVGAAFFLMYLTVHLIGWGCFGILFLSYVTIQVGK